MLFSLSVATPLSDELKTDIFFPSCPVLVEGRELLADFFLLDVIYFNVILGMDWLAQHYTSLDYREKEVIFLKFPLMMNFDYEVIKDQCLRILFLLSQLGRCLREDVEAT